MSDSDRFSLFTEARERLGRSLVRGVAASLPEVADALEDATDRSDSIVARRQFYMAATALRDEGTARAQRSLGRLYDLTFRMLEANQATEPNGEPPLLALLQEDELDLQIFGADVAAAVRERLAADYDTALRRVDALTRTPSDDAHAPLGASLLAAAAMEAFRPLPADRSIRPAIRLALLQRLAPRLAEAILETDAWLGSRGVEPWSPPPEVPVSVQPEPMRVAQPEPVPAPQAEVPPAEVAIHPSDATASAATNADPAPVPEPEAVIDPVAEPVKESVAELIAEPVVAPAAATAAEPVPEPMPEPQPAPAAAPLPAIEPSAAPAPGGEARMEHAAEALVHATQVADVLGRQPFAVGRTESGYRHAGGLPRPEALLQDAVAFAHRVGVAPYTRVARQRYFDALRSRMADAQVPSAQLAALDLVAALFDYVVDDARMPPAAQPLLWRLQHPSVTLAALDAGYLGDHRRSVRRLVENVAAIAVAYADDVTQGSELYRRLETVVRAVEVVSHAFQARSSVLGDQVRREYDRAAQGVAQLVSRVANERLALEATPGRRNRRDYRRRPSRDREQAVTRRLEDELQSRMASSAVPESVREFLLGVWLRHLRTALLRDGEDSQQYQVALQVVDDLIWTLDGSAGKQSRRQLASRIPPLIRLLTQGVSDIGAKPEEFRPFLDELFLIHLRKMQKVPRETDGVPASAHPVPSVPEPPAALPTLDEPMSTGAHGDLAAASSVARADPGAGSLGPPTDPGPYAVLIDPPDEPAPEPVLPANPSEVAARTEADDPELDPEVDPDPERSGDQRLLSVLSTLELDDFPAFPQHLKLPPDESVARLRRGDWLELIGRDGLPQVAKVAWINTRRTVVLLVRRPDRRALSLRVDELHERFANQRATLIV